MCLFLPPDMLKLPSVLSATDARGTVRMPQVLSELLLTGPVVQLICLRPCPANLLAPTTRLALRCTLVRPVPSVVGPTVMRMLG